MPLGVLKGGNLQYKPFTIVKYVFFTRQFACVFICPYTSESQPTFLQPCIPLQFLIKLPAISLKQTVTHIWHLSAVNFGPFSHISPAES